ncbi:MAG: proton-conducting membrane transporter [Acidobacteria bacterium]|nr:proton-conducting membrane transporter [Acidobacteriota bacterium]
MNLSYLLCAIVLLPGLTFATLGVSWLLGWQPRERTVARLTALCYSLAAVATAWLWIGMVNAGQISLTVPLGSWFSVEAYSFPLMLMVDRLSLPLVALSVLLVGVVGVFSVRYLHRDPGFHRFFLLLNLFGFGILLLFTVGSFDLLISGWELVGLTSVLLIAFFQHRDEPVKNALRVFATYRTCDIGLLVGVVMMHHFADTTEFSKLFTQTWPGAGTSLSGGGATLVGFLLLLAAMGKAAQVPFSGWLPRAMEGPTPSSAIFYGALSVHAGAYLLLRAQPILEASMLVRETVIVIGLLTALHGTFVGRACADAKTSLAYASMTQLGIIFMEIGFGLTWLALLHICGHAVVRTLQFLRAPSMLHDFHRVHAAAGGHLGETGAHYEQLLPEAVQGWLYRLALDRGHHDTFLDRFIVAPVIRLATRLNQFEMQWIAYIVGPGKLRRQRLSAKAGVHRFNQTTEDVNV